MSAPLVESYTQIPHRKPIPGSATQVTTSPYTQAMQQYGQPARRTLSNATASTSSTTSSTPRRTSSNRSDASSGQSTSYVALLRKQKATVWCDRSQTEDPRKLAAQRQAKERAEREVSGAYQYSSSSSMGRGTPTGTNGGNGSSSFGGGVARKIRHHGKPGTTSFNTSGANMAGTGVPMRLSASEVEDEDPQFQLNDWDRDPWGTSSFGGTGIDNMGRPINHRRTGSGRSSLGSGTLVGGPARLNTASSTPTSSHSRSPSETLSEETPMPTSSSQGNEYFQRSRGLQRGGSGSSSSNSERENSFGGLADIPESERFERVGDRIARDSSDDLRRRGSVDDRTTTMSRVRLFVANPDLSD